MTEEELVKKCQRGGTEEFGQLYDLYIKKIYDFIYYKTHHKPTAEDLTSDTFLKALKNIRQFDSTRSFKSWIYKIAQNTVIDHYRKFRPTADIDDIWDIGDGEDVEADIDTRQDIKVLKKYLQKLPSIQRDVIILRVWQELSYREISDIVGKSEENCKVIYSRALKSLKNQMPALIWLVMLMNM